MITYNIQFRFGDQFPEEMQRDWYDSSWRDYETHDQALSVYESMTGPDRAYFNVVLPAPQDIRIVKVERHHTYIPVNSYNIET